MSEETKQVMAGGEESKGDVSPQYPERIKTIIDQPVSVHVISANNNVTVARKHLSTRIRDIEKMLKTYTEGINKEVFGVLQLELYLTMQAYCGMIEQDPKKNAQDKKLIRSLENNAVSALKAACGSGTTHTCEDGKPALFYLALHYYQGNGVEQDTRRALSLAIKSFEEFGFGGGMSLAGSLYMERPDKLGVKTTEEQHERAVELWTRGMEAGHDRCAFNLGVYYRDKASSGNADDAKKYWPMALNMFQKAADAGFTDAHMQHGMMLAAGSDKAGVKPDRHAAVDEYYKAYQKGNETADFVKFVLEGGFRSLNTGRIMNQIKMAEEQRVKEALQKRKLDLERKHGVAAADDSGSASAKPAMQKAAVAGGRRRRNRRGRKK